MGAGQPLLLGFRHLGNRQRQFHHLMAMRGQSTALQPLSAPPTARRPTDHHCLDLLRRHERAVMGWVSRVATRLPA